MRIQPPKFFKLLFKNICNDSFHEELQGDLEEKFSLNLERFSKGKANSIYRKEVFKMLRLSVIKKPKALNSFLQLSLFQIHLKLAFRNISRNKVFSAVNIFGLAAALTISMFAVNMIYTGFKSDTHHDNADRIYRVTTKEKSPVNTTTWATSSFALKWRMPSISQIEKSTTFWNGYFVSFDLNGETINASGMVVEASFFDLFKYNITRGSLQSVFDNVNSIAISTDLETKLFGNESALGQLTKEGFIISAVLEVPKRESHIAFDFIHNRAYVGSTDEHGTQKEILNKWSNYDHGYFTYFKLAENTKIKDVNNQLALLGEEMSQELNRYATYSMIAQPINKIMFGKRLMHDFRYVYPRSILIPLLIPLLVLISLACFNYTNMSIARAFQRSKEFGIRKISGSSKAQVIGQFLIETVLFSVLAFVFAIIAYQYFTPKFEMHIQGFSALFNPILSLEIVLLFLLFSITVGLFAGIFPALHFSKISPLSAINNKLEGKAFSFSNLKRILVSLQLVVSSFCILFIVLINHQKEQLLAANLGFETAELITFPTKGIDLNLLTAELDKIAEINAYTATSMIPGAGGMRRRFLVSENYTDTISAYYGLADAGFNSVYKPQLKIGSGFTKDRPNEIIVDHAFLAALSIPLDSAIGSMVHILHYDIEEDLQIIGVMDSYIYNAISVYHYPVIIRNQQGKITDQITVSTLSNQSHEVIEKINAAWATIDASVNFEPVFVSDAIEKKYESFYGIINIMNTTGAAVIIIALLGQFGMALYNAQSRVKEIGVRQVLGASFYSLTKLFSKRLAISLTVSALITIPLIFFVFKELIFPSFSVKMEFSVLHVGAALLFLWITALAIMTFQTWQTAKVNPSESLRNE